MLKNNAPKPDSIHVSRREFIRYAGWVAGIAALGSVAFLSACSNIKSIFNKSTTSSTFTSEKATNYKTFVPSSLIPKVAARTAVSPDLLALTLLASSSAGPPADPSTAYTVKDRLFIDWNPGPQTRWFRWNLAITTPAYVLWQVSMMPFNNSPNTVLNPPGLVSSAILTPRQTEFGVDTSKFVPSVTAIRSNFAGPLFNTVAQQNVSMNSVARIRTITPSATAISAFSAAITSRAASTNTIYAQKKALLSGFAASLGNLTTSPSAIAGTSLAVSDATMASIKSTLETTATVTLYTYYIRAVALDTRYKPIGAPSNVIQILYGDPIFEDDPTLLSNSVECQFDTTGDFQYFWAVNLDWNSGAANLNKRYIAPLAETKDYAYTWFQVTQQQVEPVKAYARYPDGLVATVLSQQILTNTGINGPCAAAYIDFSKFAPPADPKNPAQTRYYVRAVHVYADPAHTGYASLAFSPPGIVNYGDPKALAMDDSMVVNIDIGTPSIRFVSYTPPFFGDNPGDHAIVTQTPGAPFDSLQPNTKVAISDLEAWLEDQERNEDNNLLNLLADAFQGLVNGLADLVNSVGDAWAQIQSFAVTALASVGIPPVIGGFLINAALMAAGIPPTLPNFNDLSNLGAGAISDMIVEQSGGLVPQSVADAASQQLMQQAQAAASATVSGLPDDLSALNGCLTPDADYVWKPGMISLELYNPFQNQIPSGSFVLRFVDAEEGTVTPATQDYFKPQTINYPPIPPEKKIALTIPLDENCEYMIYNGVKQFPENYSGGEDDTTWNKLVLGLQQLMVVVENKQPNIPDPADYEKELGTSAILIHFNIVDSMQNTKQDLAGILSAWNAPDDRFPSTIFVATFGNDSSNGSIYHPVKTLAHALSMAGASDAIVMSPGTYQADNLSVTQPYLTIAGLGSGVVIKTSSNVNFAFNVSQAATEFCMKGLEIDGGLYINGPDGVVLDGLKIFNPRAYGIQMSNCSEPLITNCEIGKNGSASGSIVCGIILNTCYAFAVSNCYIHDIMGFLGYGVQVNGTESDLGVIKNSTIDNCMVGVVMGGSGNMVANCYIHDTQIAGVEFIDSSNCSFSNCSLFNTAADRDSGWAPITFGTSTSGANSVTMDDVPNYGPFPHTFYAEKNIIAEGPNNNCIILVNASSDLTQLGIEKDQDSFVQDNIYYSQMGYVKYVDLRTGHRYQFTETSTLPSGITSFDWDGATLDRHSQELDPKLDGQGRSVVPDCLGLGIQ